MTIENIRELVRKVELRVNQFNSIAINKQSMMDMKIRDIESKILNLRTETDELRNLYVRYDLSNNINEKNKVQDQIDSNVNSLKSLEMIKESYFVAAEKAKDKVGDTDLIHEAKEIKKEADNLNKSIHELIIEKSNEIKDIETKINNLEINIREMTQDIRSLRAYESSLIPRVIKEIGEYAYDKDELEIVHRGLGIL